ncbi:MAG TPA: class F sortase [Marmoricola sp.]|nr:class F sortase [Marmoricola sp.]
MRGKRKRVRRGHRRVFWTLTVTTTVAVVLVPLGLRDGPHPVAACCLVAAATEPTAVASPRYLNRTYVAPADHKREVVGHLSLPRLKIRRPVLRVGWDRDAMSVPEDPDVLGWFSPSAHLDDLAGVSLIAGHVSDSGDRPGPLARLVQVRIGDVIEWEGLNAQIARFRVTALDRYPRATGLPPSLFKVDGPHTLRLVTCATRAAGPTGVHYSDNLVVSAVAMTAN